MAFETLVPIVKIPTSIGSVRIEMQSDNDNNDDYQLRCIVYVLDQNGSELTQVHKSLSDLVTPGHLTIFKRALTNIREKAVSEALP